MPRTAVQQLLCGPRSSTNADTKIQAGVQRSRQHAFEGVPIDQCVYKNGLACDCELEGQCKRRIDPGRGAERERDVTPCRKP